MDNRVFAIGDIHGCYDGFRALVEKKLRLKKDDKLILLGDYIDRGPQSKEVLDYIIELLDKGYNIVPLRGNHEQLLLDAYENKRSDFLSHWLYNGGDSTMESFGLDSLKDIDPVYIEFFKGLDYYYAEGDYIFVHAGFNDDLDDPFLDLYRMIWFCNEAYDNPLLKDKIIIHGHCPVDKINCIERVRAGRKVIDIDTGYVFASTHGFGHLTALEVNSMELYFHRD